MLRKSTKRSHVKDDRESSRGENPREIIELLTLVDHEIISPACSECGCTECLAWSWWRFCRISSPLKDVISPAQKLNQALIDVFRRERAPRIVRSGVDPNLRNVKS